jgi:hypothetical protein
VARFPRDGGEQINAWMTAGNVAELATARLVGADRAGFVAEQVGEPSNGASLFGR